MPPLNIDAIVLAGGLGTRLRELHPDSQKVVVSIGGRPFLERIIEMLSNAGCRRIIFAVGHKADQIKSVIEASRSDKTELLLSEEDTPLGTGGALRLALDKTTTSPVLVLNGDSFVQADFSAFKAWHIEKKAKASLLLTHVESMIRFGAVETDTDGRVIAFHEKDNKKTGPGYINAGVYLLERHFIEQFPSGQKLSLENDVFPELCKSGLYALKQEAPFIDIGTPDSCLSAEGFFDRLDDINTEI